MDNHSQFSGRAGVGEDDHGEIHHRRKHVKTTDDFTLRKRVPAACQFCRLRKTKCDNARPSCGYCVRQKALCIYENNGRIGNVPDTESIVSPRPDNSEIIRRLDEIKHIMERGTYGAATTPPGPPSLSNNAESHMGVVFNPPFTAQIPTHSELGFPSPAKSGKSPFSAIRCESVLQWPVFRPIIPKLDEVVRSLALLPNVDEDEQGKHSWMDDSQAMGSTDESQARSFKSICTNFLIHFHPRNPILDEQDLLQRAEAADDNGLTWDSSSCLLHLVSALLFSTIIWVKPVAMRDSLDEISLPGPSPENKALAEFHFAEARKRIGLLGHKLIDIQCLFLAFIYEKTYFRLLQAWFYLQQAADRLKVRLIRNNAMPWGSDQYSRVQDLHLEQRVFWSCFRAERELLLHIDLPRSGLEDLSYPHQLPQPPTALPALHNETDPRVAGMGTNERQLVEQGWGYYLAEISLRRTIDATIDLLYERSEDYWVKNPAQILSHYHALNEQRDIWRQHLPTMIQFDEGQIPDNEFSHGLRSRFLEWHELILRPFVYYVLHLPDDKIPPDEFIQLSGKAVNICAATITQGHLTLRHGGSWFIVRRIFLCACLILAAVLDPRERITPPNNWDICIRMALRILGIWGREATNIGHMTETLAHLYSQATGNIDVLL